MCHLSYNFIRKKKRATKPHSLQQTHYRVEEDFPKFITHSAPLNISRRVSWHCSIPSNHPITYQRYEKGNRHTASSIRNIPHDYWSNRTTHNRHDKQRRSVSIPPMTIQLHPQCLLGIQGILRNWTFLILKQI